MSRQHPDVRLPPSHSDLIIKLLLTTPPHLQPTAFPSYEYFKPFASASDASLNLWAQWQLLFILIMTLAAKVSRVTRTTTMDQTTTI